MLRYEVFIMTTAILLLFALGIAAVIAGIVMPDKKKEEAPYYADNAADKTIEEINSFSENVFAELNDKYNELLFLYRMIDEKKDSMCKMAEATGNDIDSKNIININDDISDIAESLKNKLSASVKKSYSNSKLEDIKKLHNDGFSVHEIAEKLNMGHREVELIMKLGRIIE